MTTKGDANAIDDQAQPVLEGALAIGRVDVLDRGIEMWHRLRGVLRDLRGPVVSDEVLATAVKEAHRHNRLIIAHATKADAARRAVRAGVDGLGHLFVDGSHPDLVSEIAEADTFVIPTLTVVSSALGHNGRRLRRRPESERQVAAGLARVPPRQHECLSAGPPGGRARHGGGA